MVKLVNHLMTRAAIDGASDIHVEPFEERTTIRYRIDGLLYDLLDIPRHYH
ncbi:MAG: type II secretion system protein GspE, partial [Candidatus Rokuibacteriota bacterium]